MDFSNFMNDFEFSVVLLHVSLVGSTISFLLKSQELVLRQMVTKTPLLE